MSATASFEPLTPTSFLLRAGRIYADSAAVIDDERRYTYAEFLDRCLRLSGALRNMGVQEGGRVAVLSPNTHLLLESHYGVPFAGAVLVALNTRLTAADLSTIIVHSGAQVLIFDYELEALAQDIAARSGGELKMVRGGRSGDQYERLLAGAAPWRRALTDERALIAINYTSGTTGRPKGVMYHHRGAYLQALAMAMETRLDCDSTFLWTLPMFHCNGWCFPWTVAMLGGTHVCLRKVEARPILEAMREYCVDHYCAAPIVHNLLIAAPADARAGITQTVRGACSARAASLRSPSATAPSLVTSSTAFRSRS